MKFFVVVALFGFAVATGSLIGNVGGIVGDIVDTAAPKINEVTGLTESLVSIYLLSSYIS